MKIRLRIQVWFLSARNINPWEIELFMKQKENVIDEIIFENFAKRSHIFQST